MPSNNGNGDEIDVEYYATKIANEYPLNDPRACLEIREHSWRIVKANLDNRVARHARTLAEDERMQQEEDAAED